MNEDLFPRDQPIDAFRLGLHDIMLSGWYNAATGELAPGFPVHAQDVLIDVGCGDGGMTSFSARQGAAVILADIDAGRIAQARARLAGSGARSIEAHVTNADPLPVADGACSRVVCTEVLEHVEDPAALMGELARIGAPGALYLITVPGAEQERLQTHLAPDFYFQRPNHIRIIDADGLDALAHGAGLEVVGRVAASFFWSMWWLFFWQANIPLGPGHRDPALDAWSRTWAEVLNGRDGLKIKRALDDAMPKVRGVVARKAA